MYDEYIIKLVRKVPGRPHEIPRTIVLSSGEKKNPTKFHNFRLIFFSSFQNVAGTVLDTVNTWGILNGSVLTAVT